MLDDNGIPFTPIFTSREIEEGKYGECWVNLYRRAGGVEAGNGHRTPLHAACALSANGKPFARVHVIPKKPKPQTIEAT